jgi:hypothetical protein
MIILGLLPSPPTLLATAFTLALNKTDSRILSCFTPPLVLNHHNLLNFVLTLYTQPMYVNFIFYI